MGIEETVIAASGALGLLIGSFLNVVIIRLPKNESIVHPRSHCSGCGETIRWYDNIPVLSYLLLRGKCRHCGTRFSARYAIVELVTGLLFAALAWNTLARGTGGATTESVARLGVYLYLTAALVASTFIDLEHQIIPDEISISGCVLAPILSMLVPSLHGTNGRMEALGLSVLGGIVGAGGIWLIGVFGKLIFRKEAMGFGDVKLMGMIGGLLGWKGVGLTFLIGCVSGSIIGLLLLAITKSRYLPFAPYLSFGAMVVVFFGREIGVFLGTTYPEWIRSLFIH
ncbi:MAG: prepilin peptidase [Planctomycetes bacterium]|nr:prepilin peptidase [Planctomycetota bacterium]MBI3846832.1 prepilin peptidase [Planctomycetota bacterium]